MAGDLHHILINIFIVINIKYLFFPYCKIMLTFDGRENNGGQGL